MGDQVAGSIAADYATGNASADGTRDGQRVGGLVGNQANSGEIVASYATGEISGSFVGDSSAGALLGYEGNIFSGVRASYGFSEVRHGATDTERVSHGSPPDGVGMPSQLTADNAGDAWNAAVAQTPTLSTLGAWDFGTDSQPPALRFADYDGPGPLFDCSQFPVGACGTLLPGQDVLRVEGPALLASGEAFAAGEVVRLSASLEYGRAAISSWSWRQLAGPAVVLSDADTPELTFTVPNVDASLVFQLTAVADDGYEYSRRVNIRSRFVIDSDGDGLLEIHNLTMLHNMRHNLAGTSYRTSTTSAGVSDGCPGTGCNGYELAGDLDFDTDGDGSWSGDSDAGYTLDVDDSRAPYFVVDADGTGGWQPIGAVAAPFAAVFDGNGHRIRNLGIRRAQPDIGLFGVIGEGAAVRNLGLVDNLADYTGSDGGDNYIGGLAGRQSDGSITASHATGPAAGGDGDNDHVGGLVGEQSSGSITASYARGPADGRDGDNDHVGGLVGVQSGGSITASYATGAADGGGGANDDAGGLAGSQSGGSITASYASGAADGGGGTGDFAGALLGRQSGGSITASYGFGAAGGRNGFYARRAA